MIPVALQVAIGGALGALARFYAGKAALALAGPAFPLGTLSVNVLGSFLMGVLYIVLEARGMQAVSPFLMVGVLGGFTTFSAFSLDTLLLVERGQVGFAALYVVGSVVLSLGALWCGVLLARGAAA